MEAGLEAAGSSMSRVARVDQYYPDLSCVAPYQAARKKAFEHRQVAPSTSVLVSKLQRPGEPGGCAGDGRDLRQRLRADRSAHRPEPAGLVRLRSLPARRRPDLRRRAAGARRRGPARGARRGGRNRISGAASPSSGLASGAIRARSRVEGAGLCQPAGGHSRVLGGVEKRFRQAPAADDRRAGAPSCIPDQRRHGRSERHRRARLPPARGCATSRAKSRRGYWTHCCSSAP